MKLQNVTICFVQHYIREKFLQMCKYSHVPLWILRGGIFKYDIMNEYEVRNINNVISRFNWKIDKRIRIRVSPAGHPLSIWSNSFSNRSGKSEPVSCVARHVIRGAITRDHVVTLGAVLWRPRLQPWLIRWKLDSTNRYVTDSTRSRLPEPYCTRPRAVCSHYPWSSWFSHFYRVPFFGNILHKLFFSINFSSFYPSFVYHNFIHQYRITFSFAYISLYYS